MTKHHHGSPRPWFLSPTLHWDQEHLPVCINLHYLPFQLTKSLGFPCNPQESWFRKQLIPLIGVCNPTNNFTIMLFVIHLVIHCNGWQGLRGEGWCAQVGQGYRVGMQDSMVFMVSLGSDSMTCICGTFRKDLRHMPYMKLVRKHLLFLNMHRNYLLCTIFKSE
jgi:hypothetical protein